MITIMQMVLIAVGLLLISLGSDTGNFADTAWYGYVGIVVFIVGLLWNFIVKGVDKLRNGRK
jgi:hypothetical protein